MGDSSSNRPNAEEFSKTGSPSMWKKEGKIKWGKAFVAFFWVSADFISQVKYLLVKLLDDDCSSLSWTLMNSDWLLNRVISASPTVFTGTLLVVTYRSQAKMTYYHCYSMSPGCTHFFTTILFDSRLVDSLSKGWTDEKHTLFLNSIESSFVNELHNGEYNSKAFLGWISRTNVHKGSCRPYETDLKPDQFKVLRKGCWENLVYDRDKKNAQIEVDSFPLSANPWIKHFRSPWITSEKNLKSSDRIDDSEFTRPSLHVASEGHYGEGTSIKQNYSQNLDGDSEVWSLKFMSFETELNLHLAEVSDQNFLDDVPVSWKRSSIIGRKRKLGAAVVHDSINEQLTPSRNPSLMPTSDGNHTPPHVTTSESSRRTSEVIASTLLSDSKEALRDDKEVIS
ncbi:hypothetical protein ZIOFF_064375 [Zingiber officinale]|uniref:Uncharacterized protein n=1 Tax=Zingiber officinale TaxID=94328 RepID=A0A8J5KGA5_ZINOF|nr:hypothetical protein ZIOFF_064375 [Zingiber officinale]